LEPQQLVGLELGQDLDHTNVAPFVELPNYVGAYVRRGRKDAEQVRTGTDRQTT
jgi:hypothetical protein